MNEEGIKVSARPILVLTCFTFKRLLYLSYTMCNNVLKSEFLFTDDEDESLPRTDSEEESIKPNAVAPTPVTAAASTQRRRQHNQSHSLYSGPRPQQQRNLLQRARNSGARGVGGSLTVSTLNPPRSNVAAPAATADGGLTQSLYVVSPNRELGAASLAPKHGPGNTKTMEESWYVTTPPCFTSIGPINMESSPFENLLIEHPR